MKKTKRKLMRGDCLERMSEIEDGTVDMVMADPPYGTTACKWDSVIDLDRMWEHLKRVTKPNGAIVLMAGQPFTSVLVCSNLKMFKYCWVWEKTMPTGMATSAFMPMKYHEDVTVFVAFGKPVFNKQLAERSDRGKTAAHRPLNPSSHRSHHVNLGSCQPKQYHPTKVNPKTVLKFGSVPNCHGKQHPTQKPVALMEYLIKTYTNPGDTVLDFCMGSGTTGVAAKQLKRNFIGIEMDRGYYKIARDRIRETVR